MAALTEKYRPYPAYKPSGVEWLREIPKHWDIKRLKYVTDLNPKASEGRKLDSATEVSFVPMESVGEWGGLDLSLTKELADIGDGYTYFADGDVLVAKITPCFENGKGSLAEGLVNGVAFGTTELHVLRCRSELDRGFAFHLTLTDAFRKLGEAEMYGAGGQKRVPESFVTNLKHPIPPLPEQRAITAFLDREIAKLDALVSKKERLIELLREKRNALISHAVTNGLNPDAPMKDSGVEWLGEIPAHWEVGPVWTLFELGRGRVISHEDIQSDPGPYPVFSSQTEYEGIMGHIATYDFEGDYLTWTTDGAKAGSVFSRNGRFNCTNVCGTLRPKHPRSMNNTFFREALNLATSGHVRHDINPKLMNDVMARIRIQLPPIQEQDAIAASLDRETAKIDALAAKVEEAIARLKELRIALISAAVTGRIDVREEAG